MYDDLRKNIAKEKSIITDINSVLIRLKDDPEQRMFYLRSLSSLVEQLRILNNVVPELLKEWSPIKNIVEKVKGSRKLKAKPNEEEKIVRISYVSPTTREKSFITLNKEDKKTFLRELKLSEDSFSSLKRKVGGVSKESKGPGFYARFSNSAFRKTSDKLVKNLGDLPQDLKKGNYKYMASTYVSIALMSTSLSFLFGILLFAILFFLGKIGFYFIWIPFALIAFALIAFYLYPGSEANSVKKKITQELPFVTIYMSAIAGSDIEPTKIFKIISGSKEYPTISTEIKKIIIQTDVYGYDLVTSLRNVAGRTPNKDLAELFSGLAMNISTGGKLKNFLEKKAENFLLDYKLERQRYSALAETFMDIYISILIAAPLVLMMMFVVMNVAGLGLGGIGISTLLFFSIIGIIIVNIIFLIVLNLKQPKI
ncbi:MAG: type II secretion system F family protein [archaeon]